MFYAVLSSVVHLFRLQRYFSIFDNYKFKMIHVIKKRKTKQYFFFFTEITCVAPA